jgi:hypothetical protein
LLKYSSALADVDAQMASLLTEEKFASIVQLIPDSWLPDDPGFSPGASAQREAYLNFFILRMQSSGVFVQEAIRARSSHL